MAYKVVVPVSGGKDSQACLKLAVQEYGCNQVLGLFNDTKFEHPKTYAHIDRISKLYGAKIHTTQAGSVEQLIRKMSRFPFAKSRFCTDRLKIVPSRKFYKKLSLEQGGFEAWMGIRSSESSDRSKRYSGKVCDEVYAPHEVLAQYPKYLEKQGVMFRLPILDWSYQDVMDFLDGEENPLYREGFNRVGCFPCLAGGDGMKEKAFRHDDFGRSQRLLVAQLEREIGKSVFTSKGGQFRDRQSDFFDDSGCSFCEI